jgi:DNA-binding LacI/PurR family transcriptional regulator
LAKKTSTKPGQSRSLPNARLEDVAKLAGVSHQTVSRVINSHPYVSAQTREKVLKAMRALIYVPNSSARTLATGRANTIGVVCYETTLYGPAATLIGIEERTRAVGLSVNIVAIRSLTGALIKDAVSRLVRQSVAGIVLMSPQSAIGYQPPDEHRHVPIAGVWGPVDGSFPVVSVDEAGGARLATRHLLELGHETVHFVGGPEGRIGSDERRRSWMETLAAAGRPVPEPLRGDWTARSGYEAGQAIAKDGKSTAVFVANDQMALGLLLALQEAGRRVPEDIAVVGFDDIPEAAYFFPPLTTIRQDFRRIGHTVADLLLEQIGGADGMPSSQNLPVELVVRRSSVPL